MADHVPDHKFNPDQTPWARYVTQKLAAHDAQNTQNQNAAQNNGRAITATLGSLATQIQAIQALETGLQAEINALIGANVNTGNVTATGYGRFGADVTASTVHASGDLNGANLNLSGYLVSPAGRAFTTLTGFAAAYLDSTGKLGINTSTVEHKQDMEPADTTAVVDALLHVALIRFRRIALVEELGDDAPWELGTIAEYLAVTALKEWTFDDSDGATQGIDWSGLVIPLIATVQQLDQRVKDLELAA